MYTIYTTDLNMIFNRLQKKNIFNSISSIQKKILLSEIQSVEIVNTREVFILSLLVFIWFKTYVYCIITLKDGRKIALDISKKDINRYFSNFL